MRTVKEVSDSSGGEGTAEFAGRAIEIYCAHSGGQ